MGHNMIIFFWIQGISEMYNTVCKIAILYQELTYFTSFINEENIRLIFICTRKFNMGEVRSLYQSAVQVLLCQFTLLGFLICSLYPEPYLTTKL